MSPFIQTVTIICAVGSGMAAGTFFTFSTFTMEGLKRLSSAQGADPPLLAQTANAAHAHGAEGWGVLHR